MNSSRDDLVPEGGMYARVPIPAVKALVYSGNRAAARVLMALCLHLGKNSRVVWPGYPTIALFAYVSENNIRKILNTLISMGYVSVEKKRNGRRFQNYYSILPAAYVQQKIKKLKVIKGGLEQGQHWICKSCLEDVDLKDAEYIQARNWDGDKDDHWKHVKCVRPYDACRVVLANPGILQERENQERENLERIRLGL